MEDSRRCSRSVAYRLVSPDQNVGSGSEKTRLALYVRAMLKVQMPS